MSNRDESIVLQQTQPTMAKSEQQLRREFHRRFLLAKAYCGRSNAEIARRCRASESSVSSYADPTKMAMSEGIKMLQLPWALGVSGHWLMTGEGPMVHELERSRQMAGAREAIARSQQLLDEMRVEIGEISVPHDGTDGNRRDGIGDRRAAGD